jgi:5-methylcytosine-specific restriction endonuclease McrA
MDESTSAKVCSGCKASKPLGEYCQDRQKSDGLSSRCKSCRAEAARQYAASDAGRESQRQRSRRYAQANPEKASAAVRAWRERHPDYSAEHNRKWREANPDASARYYAENRDRVAEMGKAWRKVNAERKAEANRIWAESNRESRSASARKWQQANPEKAREIADRRRARKRAATVGTVDLDQLWVDCLGLCGICGDVIDLAVRHPNPMSKSIDHIVPLAAGGTHEQANLQWAHLVCNIKKGARAPDLPRP